MEKNSKEPSLYGIKNSNRQGREFFGKNQFNSSFPVSLACYMRDQNLYPVYLKTNKDLFVQENTISFDEVFNTHLDNDNVYFDFESIYEPYMQYSYNTITGIDLVVRDENKRPLRPLEIKLTAIPDAPTSKENEENWGSEIVIRPASTLYCALSMFHACKNYSQRIIDIFKPVWVSIQDWTNKNEVSGKMGEILDALNQFQKEFHHFQQPVLMQPIWKTQGTLPVLKDNAFDIFIWSDFSLCRTFIDRAQQENNQVTRYQRSAARLARILFELANSSTNQVNIDSIYTQMAYGHQTDKEFALNGKITRAYMNSSRRIRPLLKKDVLPQLILNGGVNALSPERRFDQTIYFNATDLFK